MRTEEAVSAFLGSCRGRGLSPLTIAWYRMILAKFQSKFKLRLPTRPEPIEAFLAQIAGPETRHAYFRGLRAFYHFTASRHPRLPNPMVSVRAPRRRPKPPRTLTLPELGWLLAAPLSQRDRALLTLLIDTGARITEAISLNRDDIGDDTIWVTGKTGKGRSPSALRPGSSYSSWPFHTKGWQPQLLTTVNTSSRAPRDRSPGPGATTSSTRQCGPRGSRAGNPGPTL